MRPLQELETELKKFEDSLSQKKDYIDDLVKYYHTNIDSIRESLRNFFIKLKSSDISRETLEAEPTSKSKMQFDFENFSKELERCLAFDCRKILQLDEVVSKLGLVYNPDFSLFIYEKNSLPYNKKIIDFLDQFCYAMSAYKVYLVLTVFFESLQSNIANLKRFSINVEGPNKLSKDQLIDYINTQEKYINDLYDELSYDEKEKKFNYKLFWDECLNSLQSHLGEGKNKYPYEPFLVEFSGQVNIKTRFQLLLRELWSIITREDPKHYETVNKELCDFFKEGVFRQYKESKLAESQFKLSQLKHQLSLMLRKQGQSVQQNHLSQTSSFQTDGSFANTPYSFFPCDIQSQYSGQPSKSRGEDHRKLTTHC